MSNYGHAGTGIAEKTVTSTEKVGQLLTPYASSTLKDEENWVHENQKRIEKTLSVASLVTGDFYKTQAIQSYDRMDFKNMNNVTSEYLQNIGCHISNNESTFMINSSTEGLKSMKRSEFSAADLTSLRNTGSVTIKGTIYSVDDKDAFNKTMQNEYSKEAQNKSILSATSKDDKIRAMETIYHKGIENMKNSSNLSSIYDKQGNADAVKRECDRVARSMQNDMNNLANRSHDTRLQEYARRSQLSKADLSEINKSINANRNLSSKEKADLKELFKDKNELSGFINSGAIHGGDARRGASQQKYGSRIVTSQLLGQDMQTGIDIYRGVYKVTSLAVKSSFAFGHAISDTAANIGFAVSKPGTKLIDKTVTKITGTQNTTASNFLKNAQERRNVKRTRERSRKIGRAHV